MDYRKKIVYQSNYWYNDGLRKAQIRDMSGAIVSLRSSLQFNRENIAARNLLGLVYYGIGEVPEALVQWIISKNLRPRDNIANYYIDTVQSSAKELETVNLAIKKYNQCLAYCIQNGEDLAVIQLKQVVASHPTFLKALQLLALLYMHTGQYTRARQMVRQARKLDIGNETTLRYMRELTSRQGRKRRRPLKKKEDAVEYSLGNETIIQPRHSRFAGLMNHFAVANIFIGAVIGAAIIWFLVAPAVHQSSSDRLNSQMRAYSDQIQSLEAQVSAQTRTLDDYRAAGEALEANASAADCYEKLMAVSDQYASGESSNASMADALLEISKDTLGEKGRRSMMNWPGKFSREPVRHILHPAQRRLKPRNMRLRSVNWAKLSGWTPVIMTDRRCTIWPVPTGITTIQKMHRNTSGGLWMTTAIQSMRRMRRKILMRLPDQRLIRIRAMQQKNNDRFPETENSTKEEDMHKMHILFLCRKEIEEE